MAGLIWVNGGDQAAVGSRAACGIDQLVNGLGATHPGLRPDAAYPIGKARDEAEILQHMLLADQPDRHDATGRDGDGSAEGPLQLEYALRMVAQRAVPEVRRDFLRLVEPLVQRQIVFRCATPFARRGQRVVIAMPHRGLLKSCACSFRTQCNARCSRA